MQLPNLGHQFFDTTTLGMVLIVLLVIFTFLLWNGVRIIAKDQEAERKDAIARLNARPTTCTSDVIEAFADPTLPEISGDLSEKR